MAKRHGAATAYLSPNAAVGRERPSSRSPSRSPGRRSKHKNAKPKDYTSEGVVDNDIFLLPGSDFKLVGVLTLLAAVVRLYKIYQPSSVVFDEVHFGGFASKYIKGKFFMDVHPPLAKLLITLAGWLAGFDGDFDFKDIGKDYLEPGVPYVSMRLLPGILGVLTIPTMFLNLKAYGCRSATAAFGAALLIFENALVTQSRLILLDSPLVIFTAFTALAWTCFSNQQELGPSHAFDPSWWFWLAATGVGLGLTVSVKWVGLFTIAWVGSLTVLQLWVLLGDSRTVTPRLWFKHFFARAFCLIIIPFAIYASMFAIHFLCLSNPGDGDGFMSAEFQSTLNSKHMQDVPIDVAFGSRVTLRHLNTQGGYLHSHNHMYPEGSKQQQITLYPHKDENNFWILENQTQPLGPDGELINGTFAWDTLRPPQWIEDGSTIKLYHVTTNRRLHSHDVRPPVTEADWQNEVSAYGYEGFEGDANDLFRVEIVKGESDGEIAKTRIRTIQTKFKLVHIMTGCTLFSHKVKLPDWAYEQQEVTCARGGTPPNSIWYVEQNAHPALDETAEKVNYKNPGFFGKFWELQKVMWKTNAGLVESHAWDSRPASWPVLRRGINFWGKDHRQIYLLGNPVIWWSSSVAIAIYVAFKGISILRWQRGCKDYSNITWKRFDYEIGSSVLGWAFHYFPFYLMARQLFLHHYLPALYFAIMAMCQMYDFVTARITSIGLKENPVVGKAGMGIFLCVAITSFYLYSPLVYGNPWTQSACKHVKLFDTWDFDCNTFYTDLKQYSSQAVNYGGEVSSQPTESPKVETGSAPIKNVPVVKEQQQQPLMDSHVTPQPVHSPIPAEQQPVLLKHEERIEYRDEHGNVLDAEQVKALQGKVSFKTRHETRTRIFDKDGNKIDDRVFRVDDVEPEQVAPPHPDVHGGNPETQEGKQAASDIKDHRPASANAQTDGTSGNSGSNSDQGKAKPASDAKEATQH